MACFRRVPPTIPELNREAWASLARAAGNLHQLARHLNHGEAVAVEEIRSMLAEFRGSLIGANLVEDEEDEEENEGNGPS
jgi:hypothetical protein